MIAAVNDRHDVFQVGASDQEATIGRSDQCVGRRVGANSTHVDDHVGANEGFDLRGACGQHAERSHHGFGRGRSDDHTHLCRVRAHHGRSIEVTRDMAAESGGEFDESGANVPVVTGRQATAVRIGFDHGDGSRPQRSDVQ